MWATATPRPPRSRSPSSYITKAKQTTLPTTLSSHHLITHPKTKSSSTTRPTTTQQNHKSPQQSKNKPTSYSAIDYKTSAKFVIHKQSQRQIPTTSSTGT